METPKVAGFGFGGFRSLFREEPLRLGPLSKVTLLAGPNNAGKSNILLAAARFLRDGPSGGYPEDLDVPKGGEADQRFEMYVAAPVSAASVQNVLSKVPHSGSAERSVLDKILSSEPMRPTGDDLIWFRYETQAVSNSRPTIAESLVDELKHVVDSRAVSQLCTRLVQHSSSLESNLKDILSQFKVLDSIPAVQLIGPFRRVEPGANSTSQANNFFSGIDLITQLQKLESPKANDSSGDNKFDEINKFVQWVLDEPDARLTIPYDVSTINVIKNGLRLPLEHYGTGIQQLIIIASGATILEDKVICMEEPELNLHPIMQRKLVHYLIENTTNQYIIATHSAHMLDYERASVFSVREVNSKTKVVAARSAETVSGICSDLGYRPSDLLQCNAVIWVEGPSDRIYLQHWLGEYRNELAEGIHYSIMFYGGGLLNSLISTDEERLADFISLRNLNRNVAIIMDSDRRSEKDELNQTKVRLISELEDSSEPSMAWVTDGYTIENYVPDDILTLAFRKAHPKTDMAELGTRWDNPLKFKEKARSPDKVKIARYVCNDWPSDKWPDDVHEKVAKIVTFIKRANGLDC